MQFIIEKILSSPLNYIGSKYKLISQLKPLFPKNINYFLDLFCGGCNIGINIEANKYFYNDISENLIGLYNLFLNISDTQLIIDIEHIIERYNLSNTSANGYSYYNCNSNTGLSIYNKEKFNKLKNDFNSLTKKDDYYYKLFFTLIIFSFNNQIRFNRNGEYNLPVGKRDFNNKIKDKLMNFIRKLQDQNPIFTNMSFEDIDISFLDNDSFVYCDPPYLITTAPYTENGAWTLEEEKKLILFLDKLNNKNIRFALSNVLEHEERKNNILLDWLSINNYNVYYLDYNYNNSCFNKKNKNTYSKEVLITNY